MINQQTTTQLNPCSSGETNEPGGRENCNQLQQNGTHHRGLMPQASIFAQTTTSTSTQRRHTRQTHLFEAIGSTQTGTIPWGDEILGRETTGSARFLCQNVNGISNTDHLSKAHEIGEAARDFGVNILGLIETNVDWSYGDIRANITNTLRRYWTHSKACFSSSANGFNQVQQPGGTALIIGQPWSGRTSTDSDPSGLGRWTEATITGREKRKVTVINAYRV